MAARNESRGSISGISHVLLKEDTSYYLSCYTTLKAGVARIMQSRIPRLSHDAAHSRSMATRKRNAEKRKFLHERLRIVRMSTRWIITRAG